MTNHEKIPTQKIKIAIIDDHPLFRSSISALLETESDFEVLFEAANGAELIDKLEEVQPHVALLDLYMPVYSGKQALLAVKEKYPAVNIIIISLDNENETILESKLNGASAFIDKARISKTEFIDTIRGVYAGTFKFEPYLQSGNAMRSTTEKDELTFTKKEKLIMPLMRKKYTSAAIASTLKMNQRTVEWHRAHVLHKTNTKSVEEFIVWYAVNFGLNNNDLNC